MAITEQEAAKSSHTHLVMVILVVCFALCVSIMFVALRFWCRCIIGFSYWDDAAAVMALVSQQMLPYGAILRFIISVVYNRNGIMYTYT
jgi:hypothetical protein